MTTFTTEDRIKALENIKAGAEQQGDDDKDYRVVPSTTINSPTGKPYLTVIADENVMKLRMHNYDDIFDRGIYFTFDRKALSDLIRALEKYEDF